MFKRILIANRGEIAMRVIRTAREMGIETVSVYSDFDRAAMHTRMADRSVALGGTQPSESYLDMDKILKAAKETGSEGIHPGYGFLSENAEFARRVEAAGIVWIGPPADAIEAMGDKIESRRRMRAADVPVVPGLVDPVAEAQSAIAAAEEIGYPIALKAAAGGGGKGIRIVHKASEMELAFRTAQGESEAAFGDGRLYLERYLDRPRHIEVQVLFDNHGNAIHLGERECSIQRRHQKLIEESPSVIVDDELRAQMGEVALRAGHAVKYRGAGTVEFLWSGGEFFFLEMNTRLQVEHPITEMVTGCDLVREQLRVAFGEPLGYDQSDVRFQGHSIEVRINAEDPEQGYLPSTGTIRNLRWPGGPWVRVDSGLYRGLEVGLSYDPMLAKIIVWGPDRNTAIARMKRALQEFHVGGVRTGASAALSVLSDERFVDGDIDTHFLEQLDLTQHEPKMEDAAALAAAVHRHRLARRRALSDSKGNREGWRARGRAFSSPYAGPRSADPSQQAPELRS